MKFHIVSGMPRSGSTLLCNILNQNPKFFASSTSNLPQMVRSVSQVWSSSPEIKNLLEKFPEETNNRIQITIQGIVNNWYFHKKDKLVFDKSRGWTNNNLLLQKAFPESKMIVCVRDLREIFASIEKQNQKTALVSEMTEDHYKRADVLFKEDEMIGSSMRGVSDMLRRKPKNVYILKFDDLVENPEKMLKEIYEFLGEEYFEHQFEDVVNTAIDCDGFYLNKYPHKGEGKVEPQETSKWSDYVSQDVAKNIMILGQFYNQKLGYE